MKIRLLFCFAIAFALGPQVLADEASVDDAIITRLTVQQDAWNNGDLDVFLSIYQQNDTLSFISDSELMIGFESVAERYHGAYSNPELMGSLAFEVIEILTLAPRYAWMSGRWNLERDGETTTGTFTLLWENVDGEWLIIRDHTT